MEVLFYNTRKKNVIADFIDSLPLKQQAKVLRAIQYLREFGSTVAIPNNKKLASTPLWEIRILGAISIRLIYSPVGKNKIVILTAFKKESQKTPANEIRKAMRRRQKIIEEMRVN